MGRVLRFLLGLLLLALVVPLYLRVDSSFVVLTLLLMVGLIAVYVLMQVAVFRVGSGLNPWLGAVLALLPAVAVYVVGSPGGILFGRGEGQLAVLTFLGVSLLLAAVRADPGCEVMSISAALLGRHSRLGCLLFSPVDRLEGRMRAKRSA